MRYDEFVRRKIQQTLDKEIAIFRLCFAHGRQYAEALKISEDDLEVLWRIGGESMELVFAPSLRQTESNEDENVFMGKFDDSFLKLEIDGKIFHFIVRPVSKPPHYTGEPRKIIMVFSSDDDLNINMENETVFLTAVLDEWHKKILDLLRSGKIDLMSDDSDKPNL